MDNKYVNNSSACHANIDHRRMNLNKTNNNYRMRYLHYARVVLLEKVVEFKFFFVELIFVCFVSSVLFSVKYRDSGEFNSKFRALGGTGNSRRN